MEETKEKIRKLLALADSSTEHESKLAMERANVLMKKYSIDELSVRGMVDESEINSVVYTLQGTQVWHSQLIYAISKVFSCAMFYYTRKGGERKIKIYGTAKDRSVVFLMYEYAVKTIDRIYKKEKDDYIKKHGRNTSKGFTHSFKKGIIFGMCDKLDEIYRANKEDTKPVYGGLSYAVILKTTFEKSDKKMRSENKLTKSYSDCYIRDRNAFNSGYSEGKNVNFNQQIGNNKGKLLN